MTRSEANSPSRALLPPRQLDFGIQNEVIKHWWAMAAGGLGLKEEKSDAGAVYLVQ